MFVLHSIGRALRRGLALLVLAAIRGRRVVLPLAGLLLIGLAALAYFEPGRAVPAGAPAARPSQARSAAGAPAAGARPTAAAQSSTGTRPSGGAAPSAGARPTAVAAAAAPGSAEAAVQQTVQRGDEAQARAIASGDPTVMRATATDAYYQQAVQANQQLVAGGVKRIQLDRIEWGQVTVSGDIATAIAYETWTTEYADGATEQSRDLNVYGLVRQSGAWLVASDEHPEAVGGLGGQSTQTGPGGQPGAPPAQSGPSERPAAPPAQSGPGGQPSLSTGQSELGGQPASPPRQPGSGGQLAPSPAQSNPGGAERQSGGPGAAPPSAGGDGGAAPVMTPAPGRRADNRGESSNWSGYAASGASFSAVAATWTIPATTSGADGSQSAIWVGIGGERTHDLIQAGTEEIVIAPGHVRYDAWVEMLPAGPRTVPLPVKGGDTVSVSIAQAPNGGGWRIAFANRTTGATFDETVQYSSSLSSAEWIVEVPTGRRGRTAQLDDFGSVAFRDATTLREGRTVNLAGADAHPITLIDRAGRPLAEPSAITPDGAGFSVDRVGSSG